MGREARINLSVNAVRLYSENEALRERIVVLESACRSAGDRERYVRQDLAKLNDLHARQAETIRVQRESIERLEASQVRTFRTIAMAS